MSVTISVKTAKGKQDYTLEKEFITIGRSNTNDVAIEDPSVSRKHAVFEKEGDIFYITDLNSSNGSYINGKKVTERSTVSLTDNIIIGRVQFTFSVIEGEQESTMKISKDEMEELRTNSVEVKMPTPPTPNAQTVTPPSPPTPPVTPPIAPPTPSVSSTAQTPPDPSNIPLSKPGYDTSPAPHPPVGQRQYVNAGKMEPAGFWIRAVAYILDGFILGIPLALIMTLLSAIAVKVVPAGSTAGFFAIMMISWILTIGLSLGYSIYFWVNHAATPGKMILKLKVLDSTTMRNMSYGKAIIRLLGYMLSSIFFIGFILIAFSDKKKGLHDMIAGTVVVKK